MECSCPMNNTGVGAPTKAVENPYTATSASKTK